MKDKVKSQIFRPSSGFTFIGAIFNFPNHMEQKYSFQLLCSFQRCPIKTCKWHFFLLQRCRLSMRDWIDSLSASWTLLFPFIFQSFAVFHFHVIFVFLRTFPLLFSQPIPILTLCGQRTILLTSHSFIFKYSTAGIMDLIKYVSCFGDYEIEWQGFTLQRMRVCILLTAYYVW